MPAKWRPRCSRHSERTDGGQALLTVLILSVALITLTTYAVSSGIANLGSSARYANSSQAQLTAYSGLSQATSAMGQQTIATLPCLVTGTMPLPQTAGGNAAYSVTINYYDKTGAALVCNGSGSPPRTFGTGTPAGNPASAVLISTGTSPNTTPVVMQETVNVTATAQLLPAFDYAMFSPETVQLTSNVQVDQVTAPTLGPSPTVYGGTLSECTDGTVLQGDVYSYSDVNVNSNCTIYGNLYVAGNVAISNNVNIRGSVYAYGGSVDLTSTPVINGSIYAIAGPGGGGTINAHTNVVTVNGNLEATGSISNTSKAIIGGSIVPNDSAIAGWVMQPQVPFPQLMYLPAAQEIAVLQADGYNVISVGNTGIDNLLCTAFFVPATLASLVDSLVSTKTAIYAPTCSVQTYGVTPFILSTTMIWILKEFDTTGTTTFVPNPLDEVAGTTTFNLSIIIPYGTACKRGGGINFSNTTSFDPRINVLLYTPCTANFTVSPSMNGQIIAQNGISATNQFILNFDNLAALDVPGTSYPQAPVATVESKTVTSG